jgi:hypothetical protein
MAQKVPVSMNTAAQVATGNRKMVLEDGPDVINSDEDDEPTGSEWIWSQTKGRMRRNKFYGQKAGTADSKAEAIILPTPVATQKSTPVKEENQCKKKGSNGPRAATKPKPEQESSHPMGT